MNDDQGAEGFLKVLEQHDEITKQQLDAERDRKRRELAEQKERYAEYKNSPQGGKYRFFEGQRFVPLRLAEEILEGREATEYSDEVPALPIKTMSDTLEIYFYDAAEGIYRPADSLLHERILEELDEETTSKRRSEVLDCIRGLTYVKREDLEPPKTILAVKNGIFDLTTHSLGKFSEEFFITSKLPANYLTEAKCPLIEKFLGEIVLPYNVEKLKEIAGYCLFRSYPIQKAIMLTSEGGSGKSTYIGLLKNFLGKNNTSGVPLQKLNDRFSGAHLYGKLANLCADLTGDDVRNVGIFKQLTGGDQITAEKKNKDHFEFVNHAKLIFSANKIPEIPEDTIAIWRRWEIIEFSRSFTDTPEEDKKLLDKLTTQDELDGFLLVALNSLKALLERGNFTNSLTWQKTREDYINRSDPVASFILARLDYDPNGTISKKALYDDFIHFCTEKRLLPKKEGVFGKEIAPKFLRHLLYPIRSEQPRNGGRERVWLGLRFKDQNPMPGIELLDFDEKGG